MCFSAKYFSVLHYSATDSAGFHDQFGNFITMDDVGAVILTRQDAKLRAGDGVCNVPGFLLPDHIPAPREHQRVCPDPVQHVIGDPRLAQHEGELGVLRPPIHHAHRKPQGELHAVWAEIGPAHDERRDPVRLRRREKARDAAVTEAVEDHVAELERLQKR